jgi:hypothetical protein
MHQIRLAGPEDAGALLDLQHRLDGQSEFMLLEPGEREQSPARLRDRLLTQGQAGNLRALGLYLRCGFQVEGLRRQALVRGTTLIDEYYMGKLLAGDGPE